MFLRNGRFNRCIVNCIACYYFKGQINLKCMYAYTYAGHKNMQYMHTRVLAECQGRCTSEVHVSPVYT